MEAVLSSISSREIAAAIWLSAFVAFVSIYKPTRGSFANVLKAFFNPVLIVPLLIAALYAAAEIALLSRLGWWSVANLKTTILWVVTFAFAAMFEVTAAKNRKAGLGAVTRDIVSITGILLFIAELHSFPLPVELIGLPVITLIVFTGEVAKLKPEHAPVAKLLGCVTSIIGLSYFGVSLWKTVESWRETANWATALEFAIPVLLSLGFLPFLYVWRNYVAYSETFTTLSIFGIDKTLVPYAQWLAITRIRGDLDLLDRWRQAIHSARPSNKAELKHSLTALLALKAREAAPPIVKPQDGWSPYLAMQFMTGLSLDTGHYHHSFDEEWFASSPMREIGESLILKNNIAYYLAGSEFAATALRIKLNVNDPTKQGPAEDMFVLYAMHLLEQAISLDAVERLKSRIAALTPFEADIPFGSVALTRDDFIGGIRGGYSRTFEIKRGPREAD